MLDLEYYAGIGSRETPTDIRRLMARIAVELYLRKYVLRSGGADGADTAFERGHDAARQATKGPSRKEIFLPERWFNGNESPLYTPSAPAFDIAERFHPAWGACKKYARALHARNSHQVLGEDLLTPVSFVVYWTHPDGRRSGTDQAVRVAKAWPGIALFNLNDLNWRPTQLFLRAIEIDP